MTPDRWSNDVETAAYLAAQEAPPADRDEPTRAEVKLDDRWQDAFDKEETEP